MMTLGSQMRISSSNSTMLRIMKNSMEKIPKLELPLLMMTSQELSTSKRPRTSKLMPTNQV
jgi:hypothetical protein